MTSFFWKIEDDLNPYEIEDDLNNFANGRQPQLENGRQPQSLENRRRPKYFGKGKFPESY